MAFRNCLVKNPCVEFKLLCRCRVTTRGGCYLGIHNLVFDKSFCGLIPTSANWRKLALLDGNLRPITTVCQTPHCKSTHTLHYDYTLGMDSVQQSFSLFLPLSLYSSMFRSRDQHSGLYLTCGIRRWKEHKIAVFDSECLDFSRSWWCLLCQW